MNPGKDATSKNTKRPKDNRHDAPINNHTSLNSREWADHKYIDKVQTRTGKIRYIYELPSGTRISYDENSPQNAYALMIGNNYQNQRRLKDKEFTKQIDAQSKYLANNLKNGRVGRAAQNVQKMANEVTSDPYTALHVVNEAATNAIKSASKAVSDGVNMVNDLLSGAIANTPLKDLFK